MFYTKGIDITNDKSMFNFIAGHPTYCTMNFWNRTRSIAHNVKLYNLDLEGDWTVAHAFLESEDYETVNIMIHDWEVEHPGCLVGFNGRSGGYLVLYNKAGGSIIPDTLNYDRYEDYKADMRDYYGSVRANRDELVHYTMLIRSFDKLCDEIREYVNDLSKYKYEVAEMKTIVEQFNYAYEDDLGYLGFKELEADENGEVDLNDAIYLLYHVNFPDTYPVNQSCDFDGSGTVDLNDAIYLLYHVNFPGSYPLH